MDVVQGLERGNVGERYFGGLITDGNNNNNLGTVYETGLYGITIIIISGDLGMKGVLI